jgi:hypothetical protein
LPDVFPQQLFFGAVPEFLCTPIHIGESPITTDGIEAVTHPLENLAKLPLVNPMQAILRVIFGRV